MRRTPDDEPQQQRTRSGLVVKGTTAKARPTPVTKSVVLVEDNDSVRVLLGSFLQQLGWKVTAASNAAEAIDAFRRDRVAASVALIDFHLPDRDGDVLARELRELVPEVRIVFMTADDAFAGSSPVAPVLMKPIDLSRLATTLERTISAGAAAQSA